MEYNEINFNCHMRKSQKNKFFCYESYETANKTLKNFKNIINNKLKHLITHSTCVIIPNENKYRTQVSGIITDSDATLLEHLSKQYFHNPTIYMSDEWFNNWKSWVVVWKWSYYWNDPIT